MISCRNLNYFVNNKLILEDINLDLKKKEFVFLTGHSGAGKSSLLEIICGFQQPSQGRVLFGRPPQDISKLPLNQRILLRKEVGIVLQNHYLKEQSSVFDNVCLPLLIEGYSTKIIQKSVDRILRIVALEKHIGEKVSNLSEGEKHRVSIARSLIKKPKVIIADEPTGNLDPNLSKEIFRLLINVAELEATVIAATHDLEFVQFFQKRCISMERGRIIQDTKYTKPQGN